MEYSQGDTSGDGRSDFAWTKCSEMNVHERLSIKEQSLNIGLRHCETLMNTIRHLTRHREKYMKEIWPAEGQTQWDTQCRKIIDDHRKFEVSVGVAGATGSGKTSLLNALLGYRELLPTNNEEAATAVQCKVSFNHDERPEYAFRCRVTFQSRETLEARLQQFFDDISTRDELRILDSGSIEDDEALHEIEGKLLPSREMIRIVFNLEDNEAENLGLDGVLSANPAALKLLGTVKTFNSSDAKEISLAMKPYMDSTMGNHDSSNGRFAAWPLIEEVELFMKSEILQNGVVLVDLPGLDDHIQSRVSVTKRASDQLAATLIVAPATRAADNSTAVSLMSKHQETGLMLDGKFHKKAFCICLSQIDQIEREAALRKPDAKADTYLQKLLAEEQAEKHALGETRKLKRKHRREFRKAKRRGERFNIKDWEYLDPLSYQTAREVARDQRDLQVKLTGLSKDISNSRRRLRELNSEITFLCIRARNQFIEGRIRRDFARRQAALVARTSNLQKTYDGEVMICPTSSTAFWECKDTVRRTAGFPTECYTGIPNLASWIRNATMQKREEHVDDLLSRLQAQYNTLLLIWPDEKHQLKNTLITGDSFQKDILQDALESMRPKLEALFSSLTKDVKRKDPLKGKKGKILSTCPGMCTTTVKGWAYKDPYDNTSPKMHWTTYQGCLRRSGGRYATRAARDPRHYHWMEDISNLMLTTILKDWNYLLNHDMPSLADDAGQEIDGICREFIAKLRRSIEKVEPRLLPELDSQRHSIETIKTNATRRVQQALGEISQRARLAHPRVVSNIQSRWEEPFQKALEITGLGSYKERQKHVLNFAQSNNKDMFRTAFNDLQGQLQTSVVELGYELKSISESTLGDLRRHLSVFHHRVLEPAEPAINSAAVAKRMRFMRRRVNNELEEWTTEWQSPVSIVTMIGGDIIDQIPDKYQHVTIKPEKKRREDGLEASDLEVDSDMSSESDDLDF
ncbi:hypothetical protein NPX13_g3162 [Xylaria arbuscula]|uniref:Dynamin N-terminal domain-containing protein n=1 Tax=Xylaria arbuscula TaxID=114810 RepID=A0A9W8NIQ1_9PEZI|nr:hypothetical protein NPX13_g3162 [Xylaria arbuscula]